MSESLGTTPPLLTQLSAVLFLTPKPVTVEWLAEVTEQEPEAVEAELENLKDLYRDDTHGFSLVEVNGGYQLRTAPALSFLLRRIVPVKVKRLSRAAAETLAIVAYKQPVERAEIESIRGVDALPTVKTLLDAKLIRIVGKQDTPGQPVLYGTTTSFLERFGLKNLSDLPPLHEFEQLIAEPGEVDTPEETDEDSSDTELSAEGDFDTARESQSEDDAQTVATE